MIDPMPRLLEVHEVAYQLKCSQETVRRLIRDHRLAAIRLGAHWRIDQGDLKAYLDAQKLAALETRIAAAEAVIDTALAWDRPIALALRARDGPRAVPPLAGARRLELHQKGA